jgi:hypothetical protein
VTDSAEAEVRVASMRELLRRPGVQTFGPLLLYGAFAAIWMGRGVIPHPASMVLGDPYRDKTILMWSFMWWPHAIAHGLNPFDANVVWAPHGVDLSWVTSSPTLSLAFAPVSEIFGPVVAYNLAAFLAAPLAAWTTFLLARRLTRSVEASLVAGFLFGFSPYVLGQTVSHLNLSFVCLVPLAGLLAVRFYEGSLGCWRFTALLTLVLLLQFGISTEIFATMTMLGAVCFVLVLALLGRARMGELATYTALAYVCVAALVSPYLAHVAHHKAPLRADLARHALDLANTVIPTKTAWVQTPHGNVVLTHGNINGYPNAISEVDGYIGVPLLILLVLAAVTLRGRVRRGFWVLLLSGIAADLMALGPTMRVANHRIGAGVWSLIQRLPAIGVAIPIRLEMYAALFVALAAALWLARARDIRWRFALAGLVVLTFLPTPSLAFWSSHVRQSTFFSTSAYRRAIRPGDVALVFPYAGRQSGLMLWQAETGFRFKMIGGHTGQTIIPAECRWKQDWASVGGGTPPGGAASFRRFLLAHHVTVVLEGPHSSNWDKQLIAAALPYAQPVQVKDTTVVRIPPGLSPALPRGGPTLPQYYAPDLTGVDTECGSVTGS